MKHLLLFVLFSILITYTVYSQEKTGFSEPDSFRVVLDYRLPSWSYSNFYISSGGFNSSTNIGRPIGVVRDLNTNLAIRTESDNKTGLFDFSLQPVYEYYTESEDRFFNLFSASSYSYRKTEEDRDIKQFIVENNQTLNDIEIDGFTNLVSFTESINLQLKEYLSGDFFLLVESNAFVSYRNRDFQSTQNETVTAEGNSFSRDVFFRPTVGIGYGRYRNVTPVLRAYRLSERSSYNGYAPYSNRDILNAAHQFTQFNGYQSRYDRPLKYFWEDLNNVVGNKYNSANPFDLFFLNDVFQENLGARFEGFEVFGGFGYQYRNQLTKDRNDVNNTRNRDFSIERETSLFAALNWAKNLDLVNQIMIQAEFNQTYNNEEFAIIDSRNITEFRFEWLRNLSDQYLLTTFLNSQTTITRGNAELGVPDFDENVAAMGTSLTFFSENKMSLNATVSFVYDYREQRTDFNKSVVKNYRINVGGNFRYYFNRNLN